MLKRKLFDYLINWRNSKDKKPIILTGARQVGKTTLIEEFGKTYGSFIEINFLDNDIYKSVFTNSSEVNEIIKKISLVNPNFKFIPNDTLIFLDEIQEFPEAISSFKNFALDKRFDVICSGSLLGAHYKRIKSIPVGFKEDVKMNSMDFEEFLWANGYSESQIDDIFSYMKDLKPFPDVYLEKLNNLYKDFIFSGGMPEVVNSLVTNNVFSDVFKIQKRIFADYEDDITKYCTGLDSTKIMSFYRNIIPQLAKENHKFQISKINNSKSRDFLGVDEWLINTGIINSIHNISCLQLPFSSFEKPDYYRIYFSDHSLYIAGLDEEAKKDFILNNNFEIYNGSFYENLISESLIKSGYELYFYKNESATIELDFVIRVKNQIVPIEVKKQRGRSKSLNAVLNDKRNNIHYAVKFANSNIGYSNGIFTFPHFLSFLLKRFFDETEYIRW